MTIKEVSEKYGISQDTLRYYERIGLIPPVPRTPGGIRGLSGKRPGLGRTGSMYAECRCPDRGTDRYVRLYQMGDSTIEARRDLLQEQYEVLEEQRRQINATMERLKYKISRYQKAVETGVLSWEKEEEN